MTIDLKKNNKKRGTKPEYIFLDSFVCLCVCSQVSLASDKLSFWIKNNLIFAVCLIIWTYIKKKKMSKIFFLNT